MSCLKIQNFPETFENTSPVENNRKETPTKNNTTIQRPKRRVSLVDFQSITGKNGKLAQNFLDKIKVDTFPQYIL